MVVMQYNGYTNVVGVILKKVNLIEAIVEIEADIIEVYSLVSQKL